MKAALNKICTWFKNHLPTKRRLIQVYAALLFNANIKGYLSGRIYKGDTKYACVPGLNCYSCPGAVGSCPLGALQNALATSGTRAPYYVIGIIALFGLILGRTICGYLCPVGLGQELLYKVKTPKLKKSRFTRILSYLKYVILVAFVLIIPIMYGRAGIAVPAFCKYICPAGTFGGGLGLLLNPANADQLNMLGPIFTWKFSLMVVIIAACIFCYRAFCRFLCPLGAIYGFFNRFAFIGVHVDVDKCTDCGLCVNHCKMDIRKVGDHECINCGECVDVCPTKAISYKGGKWTLRKNEGVPASDDLAENISEASASSEKTSLSASSDFDDKIMPSPINMLVLEAAGMALPSYASDSGLPGGESAKDEDNQANISASTPDSRENEENSQGNIEAEDIMRPACSDKNAAPVEGREEGVTKTLDDKKDSGKKDAGGAAKKAALKAKLKSPAFIIKTVAVVLALALLIGAITYYALLDQPESIVIEIGSPCPDFEVTLYKQDADGNFVHTKDVFKMSDRLGKVTVINFWATWCGPCVEELPDFELLKENYPEVEVIAIHGVSTDAPRGMSQDEYVGRYIKNHNWGKILFGQDVISGSTCKTFQLLGGKDSWPITLIVNADGNFSFIHQGKLDYASLERATQNAISGLEEGEN